MNRRQVIIKKNGSIWWFSDHILHREDHPAIIFRNGVHHWYLNGRYHRTNGPAVKNDGGEEWYLDGQLHREDGPALTHSDEKVYSLRGFRMTKEHYDSVINKYYKGF